MRVVFVKNLTERRFEEEVLTTDYFGMIRADLKTSEDYFKEGQMKRAIDAAEAAVDDSKDLVKELKKVEARMR